MTSGSMTQALQETTWPLCSKTVGIIRLPGRLPAALQFERLTHRLYATAAQHVERHTQDAETAA